ncbi:MAG: alpha/beta hydrolase [Elusimicrobia bacterium]|nr:alpha/beta hydrolase [Elusimicrobiota bacterium]
MRRINPGIFVLAPLLLLTPAPAVALTREAVFLLHGLGRTRASMLVLSWRMRRAGYRTALFPYSPPTEPLDAATDRLLASIRKKAGGTTYHLIGHSLGSIIIRNGFKKGYPPGLGRVVMLAPPNQPSFLAAKLRRNPIFSWLGGDSGQRLAEKAFYASLPAPMTEFGVIAGDRGSRLLSPEPNDGVILVETAKLEGMAAFATLHHTHTFLMNGRDTFEHCRAFLESGSFRETKLPR